MATTAARSRASSPDPNVVLRAARLEAQKKQLGRTASGSRRNLSTLPVQPSRPAQEEQSFQRNPVARMRANRHAVQQYANPGASTPKLQEMSSSLRESDTDQEEDANEIAEQEMQIADENAQAESLQLAARARSRTKAATGDATQKMMEQTMKMAEKVLAQAKAQGIESAGSLIDEGEFAEVVDTIATGKSVTRAVLSIFQDSMDEVTKSLLNKLELPMYKMSDALGGISASSTIAQAGKWTAVLFVIIPFFLVFTMLAYGSIGSVVKGNLTNAYTLMKGAL